MAETTKKRTLSPGEQMDQDMEYLKECGWETDGVDSRGIPMFRLPVPTTEVEYRKVCELPVVGGGKEIVKQAHGQPVAWTYSFEEARDIQRDRDREKEKSKK